LHKEGYNFINCYDSDLNFIGKVFDTGKIKGRHSLILDIEGEEYE